MVELPTMHTLRCEHAVAHLGIRALARKWRLSRNTVRKYLRAADPVPQYVLRQPRPQPAQAAVGPRVEALLAAWAPRTTAKQRLTATRLHRELRADGVAVGERTVRRYLAERRRQQQEVFVPLLWRPGEAAQVDFFAVVVDLAGVRQQLQAFVLQLMCSQVTVARLYARADQVSFLDGHVQAFAALGGVPARLIYDNLRPAVQRLAGHGARTLAARFLALATHYAFEPCFARPGTGHDKGGVEARGKALRLQLLTPLPAGPSLAALNAQLAAQLLAQRATAANRAGVTVAARWAGEQPQLHALPATPFVAARVLPVTVTRQALVRVGGADYSVPTAWQSLAATAYEGVETVRVVCRGEEVTHRRAARGERCVCYRHYLAELVRKPQALRQVAPALTAELGEPYPRLWAHLAAQHGELPGARLLAAILAAQRVHGPAAVAAAVTAALAAGVVDGRLLAAWRPAPPRLADVPPRLAAVRIEQGQAAAYDQLLRGGAR